MTQSTWEQGDSFGREVRTKAVLEMIDDQIVEWDKDRKVALEKQRKEPQFTSWQSVAEQRTCWIEAANLLKAKVETKFL